MLRYRHSISNLGGTFYQEGMLNFVKTFPSSIKRINWFVFFSLLIYYIYWFAYVVHTLCPLDENNLNIIYDLTVLLKSTCKCFHWELLYVRSAGISAYSSLLFYLPVAHSLFPRTVLDLKNEFGCVLYFLLCGIICSESICIRSPLKVC